MKNFKKTVLALSLLVILGLSSFVYASDFDSLIEPKETTDRHEKMNKYSHCYERRNRGHKHMRHSRGHKYHHIRNRIN